MTAQRTDTIIVNDDEHRLYCLPLSQYLEKHKRTITFFSLTTSLYRGYYASWLIEQNKLYLTDFWGENQLMRKEYCLTDLFPDQEKVFANWFTGDLIIPMGKEVEYFHGGLGGWTYEYEATIQIENGLVIKTTFNDS